MEIHSMQGMREWEITKQYRYFETVLDLEICRFGQVEIEKASRFPKRYQAGNQISQFEAHEEV